MNKIDSNNGVFHTCFRSPEAAPRMLRIVVPILAVLALVIVHQRWGLGSLFGRATGGKVDDQQCLQQLFDRVVNLDIVSLPRLQGSELAYQDLVKQRSQLNDTQRTQLFHAELNQLHGQEQALTADTAPAAIASLMVTYSRGEWLEVTKTLYRSVAAEYLAYRYGHHYNDNRQLTFVTVDEQKLVVRLIPDKGDCLFLSFIDGRQDKPTIEDLRQLAGQELDKRLKGDEHLQYQLAELMQMHHDARSGNNDEEMLQLVLQVDGLAGLKRQYQDEADLQACQSVDDFMATWRLKHPRALEVGDVDRAALAEEYCQLVQKPGGLYPGQEVVMVLAEHFKQAVVLVSGDAWILFGPKPKEDEIPIVIFKTPGNAHYNRLVLTLEQWQVLAPRVN